MSTGKDFYQALERGEIRRITVRDFPNNPTSIKLIWRNNRRTFLHDREFLTFTSALNYVIKALDKPVIANLDDMYKMPPIVEVVKTNRRKENEKDQLEQASKSEDLPEGQSCPPSE